MALPIAAILAFRARDEIQPARDESHATSPAPEAALPIERPTVSSPARKAILAAPAEPVAARLPVAPSPEQVRDYAIGADEHREKSAVASSDPAGVERPVRLELKAGRITEDSQSEEP